MPVPDAHKGLFDYFRVNSVDELKARIDDDIYPVELPYHSPISDAILPDINPANIEALFDAVRN